MFLSRELNFVRKVCQILCAEMSGSSLQLRSSQSYCTDNQCLQECKLSFFSCLGYLGMNNVF